MSGYFAQSRYQVRHDWGVDGVSRLAHADVVVVVDVLRFSTTVTDAVARGDIVSLEDAFAISANGACVAAAAGISTAPLGASVPAPDVTTAGPKTPELPAKASMRSAGPLVLLGCLRNAASVAEAVVDEQVRRGQRTSVAVIAAGELESSGGWVWPGEFASPGELASPGEFASPGELASPGAGSLRFAVEDYLGAGAIVDALAALGIDHSSPEAAAAGEAFRTLRGAVRHLLTASGSGLELIDLGLRDEVLAAAEINDTPAVPVLRAGCFVAI